MRGWRQIVLAGMAVCAFGRASDMPGSNGSVRRCPEVVAAGEFRRTLFLLELALTPFKDKHGKTFRFAAPGPDGRLGLTVKHEVHGIVNEVDGGPLPLHHGSFRGFIVGVDGSIDATDAYVSYGKRSGDGYLVALFAHFRTKLPDGVTFAFIDSSRTADVAQQLRHVNAKHLEALATDGADGTALYRAYRQVRATLVDGPPEKLLPGWDPAAEPGFRHYLADVCTVWGRIARHGNFRRDYRTDFATPYFPLFHKYPIPDDVREAEDAVLRKVNPAELLAPYLPKR